MPCSSSIFRSRWLKVFLINTDPFFVTTLLTWVVRDHLSSSCKSLFSLSTTVRSWSTRAYCSVFFGLLLTYLLMSVSPRRPQGELIMQLIAFCQGLLAFRWSILAVLERGCRLLSRAGLGGWLLRAHEPNLGSMWSYSIRATSKKKKKNGEQSWRVYLDNLFYIPLDVFPSEVCQSW